MKKIILSFAIVLTLISSSFAKSPGVHTERAALSFSKDFRRATQVSFAETNHFVLATFQQDKETLFAYYDFQGTLVGVVHHILTSSLPEDLQKDIRKNYSNYWVSELFQVTSEEGSYYYIQLKNADETMVLSTEGAYGWHKYALPRQVTSL